MVTVLSNADGPRVSQSDGGAPRALSRGRTVVGSSAACDYRVVAPGVRPKHLVLSWDGRRVRVEHVFARGSVKIGRTALQAPCALFGSVRLTVAAAVLVVNAPVEPPGEISSEDDTRVQRVRPGRRSVGVTALVASFVIALLAIALCARSRERKTPHAAAPRPTHVTPTNTEARAVATRIVDSSITPAAAAFLLASGRIEDARHMYAALASRKPADPVFEVIARSLDSHVGGESGPAELLIGANLVGK
jgi:hypothetical protein